MAWLSQARLHYKKITAILDVYADLLDFVILLEEDLDVANLPLPAILEGVVLPGDVGDGLLVVVDDAMVPCPVLLVGVCLLGPIKSQIQLTLTTWSRTNLERHI